jgi:Icc-related predicted phosphoesterase
MIIIATSDLHGELPDIPPCDLLLISGDICPDGSVEWQSKWLDTQWRDWLNCIPAKEVVAVAGNHDLIFERAPELVPIGLRWHYLQDSLIELFGLKIYGTPWQLPFWGAFNLDEKGLEKRYQLIPSKVDIVISHAPPFCIRDAVPMRIESENKDLDSFHHTGSRALRAKMFEIKPKLFICGHIHCSFGIYRTEHTLFANVSLLNDQMEIAHPPMVFAFHSSQFSVV